MSAETPASASLASTAPGSSAPRSAFVVAARAGCAVVPVTIKNTGYLMPVGDEFYAGGRLRKGDVTMVVHAPLYADPSVKDPVADLQERAREAIASRL